MSRHPADVAAPPSAVCHLCSQIDGDQQGDLVHAVLNPLKYRRPICAETSEFAVMPSIGPLVPGHLLLIPKRHTRSFAGLTVSERSAGDDLAERVAAALSEAYRQPVHRFEHGSALCGAAIACSVEHAHLHLVPTSAEVWPRIRDAGPWLELADESLTANVGDREYLLYESPDGRRWVWITHEVPIASQLMRRAFAAALGIQERWDWRLHPQRNAVRATLARMSGMDLKRAYPARRATISA